MARIVMLAISALCMALTLSLNFHATFAADPPPLQNFCIGVNDPNSAVFVNGKFCKNPKHATIDDFLYKGFDKPGNTRGNNIDGGEGANATLIDEGKFPGLNTLGVAMARVDFAPYGLNTLHLHPLASEIFAVVEGTLYAGFITTDNKLWDTVITKGDMIVFPQGLVHFQLNIGKTPALAYASFGSQNPGRINIPKASFGTIPRILDDVLTKAFQVDVEVIEKLGKQFESHGIETGRSILRFLNHKDEF